MSPNTTEGFDVRYERFGNETTLQIDMEVIGFPGASGYTTMQEAEALADALQLRAGMRVLDLGAGVGWPSLYLAPKLGYDAVLTDEPLVSMRTAARRAAAEGAGACRFAVATGARLPFRPRTFDAILHTDVLC